jgi:hypothetical protein
VLFSSAARSARKLIVAVTVALALLALAAGPGAAAEGGFASVGRTFTLSGDRDAVSAVVRVNRAAAGSGLSLAATLGQDSGVVTVVFRQDAARPRSRSIQIDGFSMDFKAVEGSGCSYDMRLYCERASYDWVAGRAYKVSLVRGGRNGQGWLWTVRVRDLAAGRTTKLVSLRSPASAVTAGSTSLYANPTDCADIAPVAAVVKKPRGAGSTVAWGKAENYGSCEGATLRAPIVRGAARLSIS